MSHALDLLTAGRAQAIADFNAQDIREALTAAGWTHDEPEREGRTEYHGPCPRCGGDNRFRIYMRDRQHGVCRQCNFGGDALDCCVALSGADPKAKGARSRYLREHGHLAETKPAGRAQDFAQVRPGRVEPTATTSAGRAKSTGLHQRAAVDRPADPMRWYRADAVAAFGRKPSADEIEALDERAGILEFDGGLSRADAESQALILVRAMGPVGG